MIGSQKGAATEQTLCGQVVERGSDGGDTRFCRVRRESQVDQHQATLDVAQLGHFRVLLGRQQLHQHLHAAWRAALADRVHKNTLGFRALRSCRLGLLRQHAQVLD